jgi:hypothetical protein
MLTDQKATPSLPPPLPPPPPTTLQPRQQLLPNIDPRLGFLTPHPPPTPLSPIHRHMAPVQPHPDPSYTTHHSSPQPTTTILPTHLPPIYAALSNTSSSSDSSGSDSEGNDGNSGQNFEPSINEQSDDEDDRMAHELLHATPVVA